MPGARASAATTSRCNAAKAPALYSRLEMSVSPLGTAGIIELVAKGTIRNKEAFHRRQFQRLEQVDAVSFNELIDLWVLEYAELYAATA